MEPIQRYRAHVRSLAHHKRLMVSLPVAAASAWAIATPLFGVAATYGVLGAIAGLTQTRHATVRSAIRMVTGFTVALVIAHFGRHVLGIGPWSIAVVVTAAAVASWLIGIGPDGLAFAAVNAAVVYASPAATFQLASDRVSSLGVGVVVGAIMTQFVVSPTDASKKADTLVDQRIAEMFSLLDRMATSIERGCVAAGDAQLWLQTARAIDHSFGAVELAVDTARKDAALGLAGRSGEQRMTDLDARMESAKVAASRTRKIAATVHASVNASPPADLPSPIGAAIRSAAASLVEPGSHHIDASSAVAALRDADTLVMLESAAVLNDAIAIVNWSAPLVRS